MATDFFTQQDNARRQTWLLLALYLAAIVGIILSVYAVFVAIFVVGGSEDPQQLAALEEHWFILPDILFLVTVVTAVIVAAGSLFKIAQLSRGGEAVALLLGGRPINADTRSIEEKRLLNVVEEMAIASGVPVPPVFLLPNEEGINAFAAGHKPSDAVIGVTKGTVQLLNRDQLQGVIAHEFSHILNGDMRLNIRLMGLINGLLVVSLIGYYTMRFTLGGSSSRDKKGAGVAIAAFGIALMILGWVGVFFGQIIRAAISRQREFLADASAVQFTRNPDGIAGALKKIGGWASGSRVADEHAPEAAHMFFSQAVAASLAQMFATHPPLAVRIRRIDPNWDGVFPKIAPGASNDENKPKPPRKTPFDALPFPMDPTRIGQQVGQIGVSQLAGAAALLDSMPESVSASAHDPYSAVALVYAMLLDKREDLRSAQLRTLAENAPRPLVELSSRLYSQVQSMPREQWLPSVDLVLPTLKSLSKQQYTTFRENVLRLAKADDKTTLFEYVIWLFVVRCLDQQFGLRNKRTKMVSDASVLRPDLSIVLGLLSWVGHDDVPAAMDSYRAAWDAFGSKGVESIPDRSLCTFPAFGKSLGRLSAASPPLKHNILQACAACVTADKKVTIDEYELLRAIASVLECPLPPMAFGST